MVSHVHLTCCDNHHSVAERPSARLFCEDLHVPLSSTELLLYEHTAADNFLLVPLLLCQQVLRSQSLEAKPATAQFHSLDFT